VAQERASQKVLNHKVTKQPKSVFFFLSLVYQPVAPFLHMQKQSPKNIARNDITLVTGFPVTSV